MEPKLKQRPPSTADPPTRSSSSSSSSESESESESESDEQQQQQQQPDPNRIVQDFTSSSSEEDDQQQQQQQQPSRNPNSKPSESESESDSDSDSDSDSEPKLATPAQKHKQPAPEPPKSGSKRPAENDAGPKPASKKPTPPPDNSDEAEDDGKKPGGGGHLKFFHRVFSGEDELAILKGMVEFISRTGQDPVKYPDSFHSSMKKSLQLEASVNQLKEKIRRLRRKFEANLLRAKDGEDLKFFKSHDHTVFELSKKVWGEASMMVVKPILNGKPPKSPNPKKKGGGARNVAIKTCLADVDSLYREISGVKELNEDEMKRGLALIGESKRKELEGRWKKLRLAEIQLVANRYLLTGEQIKLIHEALESSGK